MGIITHRRFVCILFDDQFMIKIRSNTELQATMGIITHRGFVCILFEKNRIENCLTTEYQATMGIITHRGFVYVMFEN